MTSYPLDNNFNPDFNKWLFFVNAYKINEIKPNRIDSDWLDGGVKLWGENEEMYVPLPLLLVEELMDFVDWLIKIHSGQKTIPFFQFMDTELCFEVSHSEKEPLIKLNLERTNEKSISIITPISGPYINLHQLIEQLSSLINKYPCRCNGLHTVLT